METNRAVEVYASVIAFVLWVKCEVLLEKFHRCLTVFLVGLKIASWRQGDKQNINLTLLLFSQD